jgi:hypothetical protein
LLRRTFHALGRYKTNSASKSLILNIFLRCLFSGHSSQALDFSGSAGYLRRAVNKVIHMNAHAQAKRFPIKHLSALSQKHLSFSR